MARRRRNPEIIAGRVDSAGNIATGDGFTMVKAATGVYDLTLPRDFRITGLQVTCSDGTGKVGSWQPTSANAARIFTTLSTTAAGSDMAFSFTAVGVQQ